MITPAPRTGVPLVLLLALPSCFNPKGSVGTATDGTSEGVTDSTSTSTSNTTPPTTLPSQTDATVTSEPITTTEPTSTEPSLPICGDGIVQDSNHETCDDGNDNDNDDCLNSCEDARCGDGVLHAGVEGCDDGPNNANDAPCNVLCQANICGDTLLCPDCDEECDGGDGCDADCSFTQRYVFVTSAVVQGSLVGGLSGADERCAQAAGANDLLADRKFVAWLSTSEISAESRIGKTDDPYVRVDGLELAIGTEDFLTIMMSDMQEPIDIDEDGQMVVDTLSAWTGTQADGNKSNASEMCEDWIGDGTGRKGTVTVTDYRWTDDGTLPCDQDARLYCVQTSP